LPDDEIMDILTYGIPITWKKKIVELNFDTQAHTPNEFVELCERIIYGEVIGSEGSMSKPKARATEKQAKGNKVHFQKSFASAHQKGAKYCPLHKTNGHDAKECKVILAQ
jgi:hypothetical protein